jgi:hypothetical protein
MTYEEVVNVKILKILLSVSALIMLAAHLLWPSLRIDATSLGFLAMAFVPWLAQLIKSIKLPNGLEITLQDNSDAHRTLRALRHSLGCNQNLLVGKSEFAHNMECRVEIDFSFSPALAEWKRRTDPSHYLDPKERAEV